MTEDKLDQDQRIRLEALAQAVAFNGFRFSQSPTRSVPSEQVLEDAKHFEEFIRGRLAKERGL